VVLSSTLRFPTNGNEISPFESTVTTGKSVNPVFGAPVSLVAVNNIAGGVSIIEIFRLSPFPILSTF